MKKFRIRNKEQYKWILENCGKAQFGDFIIHPQTFDAYPVYVQFFNEEDAVLFALRWL